MSKERAAAEAEEGDWLKWNARNSKRSRLRSKQPVWRPNERLWQSGSVRGKPSKRVWKRSVRRLRPPDCKPSERRPRLPGYNGRRSASFVRWPA
ncbi:MAG: hypothetical protein ACLTTP_03535 [Alistipes ihumii]